MKKQFSEHGSLLHLDKNQINTIWVYTNYKL